MRLGTDGYLDLRDPRRVRTPGVADVEVEPTPEEEALAFLLTHAFPGHRRVVRPLTPRHRSRIQLAIWADSISERMALVDRVWRDITEIVSAPRDASTPQFVQVVTWGERAWPIHLDGSVTRVIPHGGVRRSELDAPEAALDLRTA